MLCIMFLNSHISTSGTSAHMHGTVDAKNMKIGTLGSHAQNKVGYNLVLILV